MNILDQWLALFLDRELDPGLVSKRVSSNHLGNHLLLINFAGGCNSRSSSVGL
jgi:hypothetical protein